VPAVDVESSRAVLERVDALVLTGGEDVSPARYGEAPHPALGRISDERDAAEIALVQAAHELRVPTLAICRGVQILNVALGGTLTQHITDAYPGHGTPGVEGGQHVHEVTIDAESRAGVAMGAIRARCSCHHHQAVDRVGRGLRVTARGDDGIVEAVELDGPAWVTAVQWHPEDTAADDPAQQGLFDAFVASARR